MIIEGAISVKAAINGGKRRIEKIYINKEKKNKDFNYIRKLASNKQIEVLELDQQELSVYLQGRSHGGIGAEVGLRTYDEFTEGDIFFLDGIEDPFNLAYAMRTLYAFGIRNLFLNQRDYEKMEAQLLKSSAGAYDLLNIRILKDDTEEIGAYQKQGYQVYALFRGEKARDIFEESFADKALFMLGGEKRGIRSTLLQMADHQLYIPYGSDFRNALNAGGAIDVTATLLFRQRKKR